MLLYKYRPWNPFTADVLSSRSIFFPTRARLNDPAELVHPVRFEASTWASAFERARSAIDKETFACADRICQEISRSEFLLECGHEDATGNSEFSRYMGMPDRFWRVVEAVFDNVELHDAIAYYAFVLAEDRANLYDSEQNVVQRLNAKLDGIGVLSLSARCDCPVMWAHYAENHRGIVLAFQTDDDELLGKARPIEYVVKRPTTTVDTVIGNLYRKGSAWDYEEEFRVLSKQGGVVRSFAAEALDRIILGARMSDTDRDAVLALAARAQIRVSQAYPDPQSFSVLHAPVTPESGGVRY